ncbi:MAG: cytidine deaminase [Bacteroidota bacterium]
MKTIEIKNTIYVSSFEELDNLDKALLIEARKACDLSHSPYSHFKVGCAIRLQNEKVVFGANQENAAYPVCLCAEGVALANASMQYPTIAIHTMAITVKTQSKSANNPIAPCGVCRQSISEYENRFQAPIRIILQGETGEVYILPSIKEILPLSFGAADLKEH